MHMSESVYSYKFWDNLEHILSEQDVSWSELARRLDIQRTSLVHAKANHHLPRIERLLKISEVLNVPLSELLEL